MTFFTSTTEIERIGLGLADRTLPKAEWTHAAHFAAAFWLGRHLVATPDAGPGMPSVGNSLAVRHPHMHAFREMPRLIRAYNEATGVANTDTSGYHETVTMASLRATLHWLSDRPERPLHESLNELLASEYGSSGWLLTHWSRPLLFSVVARRTWVEPDLRALPF
jgi:hypothetical protein